MSNRFQSSLDKAWKAFGDGVSRIAATSKKSIPKIAAQNFGGVVCNLFGLTPPMWASFIRAGDGSRAIDFEKGKAKSDNTIASDIMKATWTLNQAKKLKNNDLKSHSMATVRAYLSCRNAKKRYKGGFGKPVSESDYTLLSQVLHNRQGFTAAGWVAAAKFFKVASGIPRWVTRHSAASGGTASMKISDSEIILSATNKMKHVNASQIQQRVSIAVRMQVNAMDRAFKDFLDKKFKDSGIWR